MHSRAESAPYTPPVGRLIGYSALILIALLAAKSATAAPITISSTVNQSGFNGVTGAITPLTLSPWDFTGQQYGSLATITSISVTLTVADGDTDLGDLDEGHWTLGLDGIDTGIHLDGFTGGSQIVSLTITGAYNSAALLAALQSDGQLVGSIIDDTPGDNATLLTSRIVTTLDITGTLSDTTGGGGANNVPLPAAALMAPAAAAFGVWRARRLHRKAR